MRVEQNENVPAEPDTPAMADALKQAARQVLKVWDTKSLYTNDLTLAMDALRATLAHPEPEPEPEPEAVQVPDDSAVAELAWLENWLYFASEYVGVECCGHGVRGECCGNPNPVGRNPSEVVEAMARRHRELNAMIAAAPLPPVAHQGRRRPPRDDQLPPAAGLPDQRRSEVAGLR